MITYEKMNDNIIKGIFKGEKVRYGIIDNEYWVSVNGTSAYVIPQSQMFVNTVYLEETNLFDVYEKYETQCVIGRVSKGIFVNNKLQCIELTNGEFNVYINDKLLKEFDGCDIYIKSPVDVILFKYMGKIRGIVCPLRQPKVVE